MQAITPATFTQDTQATIATLCHQLTQATGQRVTADYGVTDCGLFEDVLLSLEGYPLGGHPAPLVTILADSGAYVVLGGAGNPVLSGVPLALAAQAARVEAMRSYRAATP